MKRFLSVALTLVLSLTLSACSTVGRTDPTETNDNETSRDPSTETLVVIGESTRFSQDEISEAIDRVEEKIDEFKYCENVCLKYDEAECARWVDDYMMYGHGTFNGVSQENVIIILSEFTTPNDVGETAFNPNGTYNWRFILIRDNPDSPWRVDDWGY